MVILLKPKKAAGAELVSDGTYKATLSNVTQFQNAYGQRIGFEFTLMDKGVDGCKVLRSTAPNLSASSKLADLLRGLLGRELTAKELAGGMDVESLIGVCCKVMVLQSKSKSGAIYSNVERVFPEV